MTIPYPFDVNGKPIKIGDVLYIPIIVEEISTNNVQGCVVSGPLKYPSGLTTSMGNIPVGCCLINN